MFQTRWKETCAARPHATRWCFPPPWALEMQNPHVWLPFLWGLNPQMILIECEEPSCYRFGLPCFRLRVSVWFPGLTRFNCHNSASENTPLELPYFVLFRHVNGSRRCLPGSTYQWRHTLQMVLRPGRKLISNQGFERGVIWIWGIIWIWKLFQIQHELHIVIYNYAMKRCFRGTEFVPARVLINRH